MPTAENTRAKSPQMVTPNATVCKRGRMTTYNPQNPLCQLQKRPMRRTRQETTQSEPRNPTDGLTQLRTDQSSNPNAPIPGVEKTNAKTRPAQHPMHLRSNPSDLTEPAQPIATQVRQSNAIQQVNPVNAAATTQPTTPTNQPRQQCQPMQSCTRDEQPANAVKPTNPINYDNPNKPTHASQLANATVPKRPAFFKPDEETRKRRRTLKCAQSGKSKRQSSLVKPI